MLVLVGAVKLASHLARGAWIKVYFKCGKSVFNDVAPRERYVDRKHNCFFKMTACKNDKQYEESKNRNSYQEESYG